MPSLQFSQRGGHLFFKCRHAACMYRQQQQGKPLSVTDIFGSELSSPDMLVYLRDGSAQTTVGSSLNMLVYLRDGSAQTTVGSSLDMLVYLRDGSAQTAVGSSPDMLVYLRDGSVQTTVRAATLRYKLQTQLVISPDRDLDTGPTSPSTVAARTAV